MENDTQLMTQETVSVGKHRGKDEYRREETESVRHSGVSMSNKYFEWILQVALRRVRRVTQRSFQNNGHGGNAVIFLDLI